MSAFIRPGHIEELRWSILAAVASASVLGACGARVSPPDEGSSGLQPGDTSSAPAESATTSSPQSSTEPGTETTTSPEASTPSTEASTDPGENEAQCSFGSLEQECYTREQLEGMVRHGTGQIPIEPTPSEQEVQDAFLPNGCLPKGKVANGCCNPATSEAQLKDALCCYTHCVGACCGRPLLVDGAARVASVERAGAWPHDPELSLHELTLHAQSLPPAVRAEIASEWLKDAQMEHASVAAFALFSLSLMAVGAPPELVQQSQSASLDEVRHARSCFAVASAYLGEAVGPGPLACGALKPATQLERLVLSTFVEGCIGETVASMIASAQASATGLGSLRQVLTGISRDEKQHAVLGWRVVAWGLRQQPELASKLRQALKAARNEWSDSTGRASHETSWLKAGRLTLLERNDLTRIAFEQVIEPALQELLNNSKTHAKNAARAA